VKSTRFWDKTSYSPLKVNILGEHNTSIFRVEYAEQDTSVKAGGKPSHTVCRESLYSSREKRGRDTGIRLAI
jgi:hypothetical protein